jgi:hypothetical protein
MNFHPCASNLLFSIVQNRNEAAIMRHAKLMTFVLAALLLSTSNASARGFRGGGGFHGFHGSEYGGFHGSEFRGGEFHSSEFRGGEIHSNEFRGGEFRGGEAYHADEFRRTSYYAGVHSVYPSFSRSGVAIYAGGGGGAGVSDYSDDNAYDTDNDNDDNDDND